MSKVCMVCDKRPRRANNVSKAKNRTIRWVKPNVQVMQFTLKGQSSIKRGPVCTKCVKANKIRKVL